MLTVADLFCGAGGFSAGFKDAGFGIVYGLDNNKQACKTFEFNFNATRVDCVDIMDFDYGKIPRTDVIIGSPPCVEFSVGNVNRKFDFTLIERFLEIVEVLNPRYWIMENVPNIATFEFFFKYADKFGTKQVLTASDFGVATVRKRFFGGKYPKVAPPKIYRSVSDVININRPGYRQPFKDNVYRKIDPSKPLFTVCSQRIGNERYLLPNGTSLTTTEMAICQGFPSWFVFPVSRSEMQRQLGNSVCPPVAKAIAVNVKDDFLKEKEIHS